MSQPRLFRKICESTLEIRITRLIFQTHDLDFLSHRKQTRKNHKANFFINRISINKMPRNEIKKRRRKFEYKKDLKKINSN